jgi:hypothetical protein
VLGDDWERMTAFRDVPEKHWRHLRTTNVVESPFSSVRPRTTAPKRFKPVGERNGAHLAASGGDREAVPEAQRSRVAAGRVPLKEARGRKACPGQSAEGRRLLTFTRLLTRPR